MNAGHEVQPQMIDRRSEFATEVRRHLATMSAEEWRRLRAYGAKHHRFVNKNDVPMPQLTRGQLVDHCVSVDACSLADILNPGYRAAAVEIGEIDGRAVFYVDGEGIYLWAEGEAMTRMLWVTHPAYPPSW